MVTSGMCRLMMRTERISKNCVRLGGSRRRTSRGTTLFLSDVSGLKDTDAIETVAVWNCALRWREWKANAGGSLRH